MGKLRLETILAEDMVEIPEPDHVLTLGDVKITDYAGLRYTGGYYVLYKGGVVIYVGISKGLGTRLYQHANKVVHSSLYGKLIKGGKTPEEAQAYLNTVTAHVHVEEDATLHNIYEKILIHKYKPKYNFDSSSTFVSDNSIKPEVRAKMVEMYLEGHTQTYIAKELGVGHTTVYNYLRIAGVKIRGRKRKGSGE